MAQEAGRELTVEAGPKRASVNSSREMCRELIPDLAHIRAAFCSMTS